MYQQTQLEGYSIVYWKDLSRPFLEIDAPYKLSEEPDKYVFLLSKRGSNTPYKRVIVPMDAISYIETVF